MKEKRERVKKGIFLFHRKEMKINGNGKNENKCNIF
jgi:hypothetical protein